MSVDASSPVIYRSDLGAISVLNRSHHSDDTALNKYVYFVRDHVVVVTSELVVDYIHFPTMNERTEMISKIISKITEFLCHSMKSGREIFENLRGNIWKRMIKNILATTILGRQTFVLCSFLVIETDKFIL